MYQQPIKSDQTGAAGCGPASSKSEKCRASLVYSPMSLLTDHDLYLFNEGSHLKLYERLGSHTRVVNGREGTNFAVWAPDAEKVFVMGAFNGWNKNAQELHPRGHSGIWEGFVPDVGHGDAYKYHVVSRYHGYKVDKADPVAFHAETPPRTASIVWNLDYEWRDQDWMSSRAQRNSFHEAISIYEFHLASWARIPEGIKTVWHSFILNYGRHEVRSFLLSSATFWFDRYHIDGLRVDAVASMLDLDYARKEGKWIPNIDGGNEKLEAIDFLRRFNASVYQDYPGIQTIAEESTAWPMVSRPTYVGGLGFGFKWDMGWMHDTLKYMSHDPVYRKYHHNELTFRMLYAFHENFILPLSHDEVVHGKGSLLSRMPGDLWQKFANMRLLYSYMYAQPAKKLLFMGGEFGQWAEWAHDGSLEWHLLEYDSHRGLQKLVADLNATYRNYRALHELDCDPAGFEWIDGSDSQQSMLSFMRKSKGAEEIITV